MIFAVNKLSICEYLLYYQGASVQTPPMLSILWLLLVIYVESNLTLDTKREPRPEKYLYTEMMRAQTYSKAGGPDFIFETVGLFVLYEIYERDSTMRREMKLGWMTLSAT